MSQTKAGCVRGAGDWDLELLLGGSNFVFPSCVARTSNSTTSYSNETLIVPQFSTPLPQQDGCVNNVKCWTAAEMPRSPWCRMNQNE